MGRRIKLLYLHGFNGKGFVVSSLYMFVLLSLLCCIAVKKKNHHLEGLWIGSYAHEIHRVHYPVIMEFKPDGTAVRIDFRRQDKDQSISWRFNDSTLTIDTIKYVVKYINENELSLFKGYEIKFQRAQKSAMKTDESKIRTILLHKSWQMEALKDDQLITTKNYYFVEDETVILRRYYLNEGKVVDSEYEISDYQIKEYNEQLFFVKKGPSNEFNIRQAELEQILEIGDDYFVTFKAGSSPAIVRYAFVKEADAVDVIPSREFKICYPEPLPEYFSIRLKYKGGFREIKRIISENYKAPQNSKNQTGYLRMRFTINCEGKPGRFNVKGYDVDLNPRPFDAEITNQLFHITRRLVDWEMMSGEKKIDCNRFLTFKLDEGFITEVLP